MLAMPYSRYIFGQLPWYSVLVVTGMALALLHCLREEKRYRLDPDTIIDLALRVIPCGIIGARLYYVAFAWPTFAGDPLSILRVWEGGLAVYGGVIGGVLAAAVFAWRRNMLLVELTDIMVPGLALAQAIGRWGNYFNMEAFGEVITNPAWQFFPAGVLIPEGGALVWHMATFFYESVWNFTVYIALMILRNRAYREFDVTCWYLLLYGAGRFVIEGLRTDSLTALGGLRVSLLLSAGMCLFALGRFLWLAWRSHRPTAEDLAAFLILVCVIGPIPLFILYQPMPAVVKRLILAASAIACGAAFYRQTRPADWPQKRRSRA